MNIEPVKLNAGDIEEVMARAAEVAPSLYMSLVASKSIALGDELHLSVVMVDPRADRSVNLNQSIEFALSSVKELPTFLMAGPAERWFAAAPLNQEGQDKMMGDNPGIDSKQSFFTDDVVSRAVKDRRGSDWVNNTSWLLIREATMQPSSLGVTENKPFTKKEYAETESWRTLMGAKKQTWDN